MATATWRYEAAQSPSEAAAWWRRKDPYVLAAVAAIHVIAHGPALRWIDNTYYGTGLQNVLTGVIMAQAFLLGTWAAFGGLRTLPRLGIISLVFLGGLGSYVIAARSSTLDSLDALLEGGLIGAFIVSFFAALMLPLRRLFGWRIDFDARHYRNLRGRRGQVGLLDFAAMSCAFGVPLTVMRLMDEYSPSGDGSAGEWASMFAVLAIVGATAGPASYITLAWRRAAAIVAAVAAATLAVAWAASALSRWFPLLDTGGSMTVWGMKLETLALHAAAAATCLTTFAVLRLFGLKLLVVPYANHDVQAPRAACYVAESSVRATVM